MLVPGLMAVVGALVTGAISFVVLMGLTPIAPTDTIVTIATVVNGAFVLLLCVLIGREVLRMFRARRSGKAASRLHVRIVVLFSIVAALPALLVAIVAGVTLDLGLDRWFEIRTQTIVEFLDQRRQRLCQRERAQSAGIDPVDGLRSRPAAAALRSRPDRFRVPDDASRRGGARLLGAQILRTDGTPFLQADVDGREAAAGAADGRAAAGPRTAIRCSSRRA